ncbi:MarR family winged helix-turn-helix transcriptional regulator [Parafrankia sp. EUN1f]|uniref:MarR family winged helix-turn-helix transcriptional regulator n=1 Tax=Parafrankia sp. EUN1f TaxID=102897 RepID=UPI0001C442FE|nr:MarR family winged helix-turn-helix transcriptional regulator [Parafrankia sp. EUN1f]EFC84566.1 transcriptional regulator, MarR family [Parafrankia sp. EUN1f]
MTRFAGGPADSPGFLLWRTTLRWQRSVADALGPLGLTHVQFVLLACAWWLNKQGQQPNQVTIAAQAATDVKMTSEVLRRLESRGLVERRPDTRDTRAKVIVVTDAGAALALRAFKVVEDADAAFFGDASVPLMEELRRLANFGVEATSDSAGGAGDVQPAGTDREAG